MGESNETVLYDINNTNRRCLIDVDTWVIGHGGVTDGRDWSLIVAGLSVSNFERKHNFGLPSMLTVTGRRSALIIVYFICSIS
jgi:hypothetical protein